MLDYQQFRWIAVDDELPIPHALVLVLRITGLYLDSRHRMMEVGYYRDGVWRRQFTDEPMTHKHTGVVAWAHIPDAHISDEACVQIALKASNDPV